MTDEQQTIGIGVAAVLAIFAVLFLISRRSRQNPEAALPPTEIARIVDPGPGANPAAGFCGVMLMIFSAISVFKYFGAESVNQQIVALLLWIGNGVFWGSFMVAGSSFSPGRTSIVYRETPVPERREPQI